MRSPAVTALALTAAALAGGCAELAGSKIVPPRAAPSPGDVIGLPAHRETHPVPHDGDAADDPAIWTHPDDPAQSTIVGTDKKGGIGVYDLRGRQLQYVRGGEPNNVDMRHGFPLRSGPVTLVAAEERIRDRILLYRVDPLTRRLRSVAARRIAVGMDVYGSCMYRSPHSGRFFVFVSSKQGRIRQFRLFARGDRVDARQVRTFDVGEQTEGCVADDLTGDFFVSEENRGIWRYGAEPGAARQRTLVDHTGRGGNLTRDVEGLALTEPIAGVRYLLASNQGSNSYAAYRRGDVDVHVAAFRVTAGRQVDGARDTDGIDVTGRPLGTDFPSGLLVVQDGSNAGGNQNFKLVRWDLAALLRQAGR